ncbi:NACHT domain-containing protein [Streptomyces sp. NPDC127190]|uniref:NACHT domain-containing protein n=1 Tax=unclassified Streptomyces TaxID=2593676 RepID=UPI00363C9359
MAAVAVTGTVFLVALVHGALDDPARLTALLTFALSVLGLALDLWRRSSPDAPRTGAPSRERLEQSAERLAAAVHEQWEQEWRLRRLQDPSPLPVQWSPAEAWLSDVPDTVGPAMEPDGRLEDISAALEAVPSRRLVVLGGPGSGKTVLAVRFLLDRLTRRAPGDPVPVIFSLSGWQPGQERLRDWMGNELRATYPGAAWTRELLKAGLVLPVLDGLDELPQSAWGTALERLNAELGERQPVLLTCRSEAYAQAVETGDVLTAAAVIELRPLTFESACAYLVRTAKPVRGAGGRRATRWDPVLAHLHTHPDSPVGHALRRVLSTPLMVAMARTVYGDGDKDPAGLLDDRFTDPAVLEEDLLEAFVPACFADSPSASRAPAWLGYLAASMQRRKTRQLAWWQLRLQMPWLLRRLGPILLLGGVVVAAGAVRALFPSGASAPVVTSAFVGGVCLGYLALSHDRNAVAAAVVGPHQVLGEALRVSVAVVPVAVAVGVTTSTSLDWMTNVNGELGVGWLAPVARAVACGLATAIVLAVLGITGEPVPLHTPLARRRIVAFPVVTLLSAAFVFWIAAVLLASVWAGAAVAAVTGGLIALGLRSRHNSAARTALPRPAPRRARGRSWRTALLGLGAGVVAGLCVGSAFGIAAAVPVGVRAAVRADFPSGTVHRLPDGTRYVVTPDGWLHGLRPDGDRYLRPPRPVDGVVEVWDDGSRYAYWAASSRQAAHWQCSALHCPPFHGRIELRLRHPASNPEVRLPNGTYVEDGDFENRSPHRSYDWLFAAPPAMLFWRTMALGLTVGLALGLASGLVSGIQAWLSRPADTARAVSPHASLSTDRATVITRGITLTLLGILGTFPAVAVVSQTSNSVVFAPILVWLFIGPLTICLSAWCWFVITRLWLCGTQRLPWRLMAFLEEAHQRGVLRQTGASYEFRHARLQDHLAARAPSG